MDTSDKILGHYAAGQLRARIAAPVLTIGGDHFTRQDLARVACFHYVACHRLETALHDLKATSTRDVFDRIPPAALAVPGVGVIALAVLGAAFQAKKLGGARPLETWVAAHHAGHLITFGAFKERAHVAAARAADDARSPARRKDR